MSATLSELEVYQKVTPIIASVLAQEAAKVWLMRFLVVLLVV